MNMKKLVLFLILVFVNIMSFAQAEDVDSVFHTYIYNEDYKVYLVLDLNGEGVNVPGQEVFGKVPGYFGAVRDSRKWLITSVEMKNKYIAKLDIVNDYGSEDLTATLIYNSKDRCYTLKQDSGSRLKIVVDRKWQKIPQEIKLVPHSKVPDEW